MNRPPTSLAFLALAFSAMLAACSTMAPQTDGAGGTGAGGVAGGGGVGGAAAGGAGGHYELCGVFVTCMDGMLNGMWGTACDPVGGRCDFGCRVASAGSSDPADATYVRAYAFAQTLCNPPPDAGAPDGGDGGGD